MNVILYNNTHYETLLKWWKQYKMDPVPIEYLGQGFMIENMCAVFIYPTGTPSVFMENLIANKRLNPKTRDMALDHLVSTVIKFLKTKKVKRIVSVTNLGAVSKRAAKKHGFRIDSKKYKLLIKDC
jgi:hypothetical protein